MRLKVGSSFSSNNSATPRSAGRFGSTDKKAARISPVRRPVAAPTKLPTSAKRQLPARIGVEVTLTSRDYESLVHEALLQNNLDKNV